MNVLQKSDVERVVRNEPWKGSDARDREEGMEQ